MPANVNPERQDVITGNDFDGAAQNAGLTSGGRWTFGNVPQGHQPRLRRLHFKGETSVTSWTWKFVTVDRGTLPYDGQTANFTEGTTLTGATSAATAKIVNDVDGGTTGTLTLSQINGTFQDDEAITDDNGSPGAAVVNGTLTGEATLVVPQGSDLEYTIFFDEWDGLVPIDHDGNPRQLQFITVGLSGEGTAEAEWDYVRVKK